MAAWLVCETQIFLIAVGRRSNPRRSRSFANSRLILIFSYCTFLELIFFVLEPVFAKQSFASVLLLSTIG